ncbi:TIGR03936 family radical SAM-associated protein [Clostridium sp. LIBA-8841]|uniref:TIGR03936 family radical SAM-associated protein n=1 Tax=Clostridium sp. LIBA-8841 TaxID=2987530 RepID=UPI002AC4549F|nr:TIGR03936 family radical SAM-associated protein [Clostridium sp. LIBA-8841]MDZ5253082.1 TIGR03936 family radical SAM-associated protein [Clostridium sp. LIBA-8841]
MRYLIKFTKDADIKFISHLDLMRTIQRIVRRAGLPVGYSKGFNPHMALAIAQPLSVGVYSEGDYLDLNLEEDMNVDAVKEQLNEFSAKGIKFLEASKSPVIHNIKRLPPAMALLDAANYTIKIKYSDVSKAEEEVNALMTKKEIVTIKKTKKGEKEADIKPFIKDFKCWTKDDCLVVNATISCGSRENLSADLLANVIKENTSNVNEEAFVEIKRVEMYAYKGDILVPLYKYI